MSDNYIGNMLGLLRLIKKTHAPGEGQAALTYLQTWADAVVTAQQSLRIAAYILDQASGAESLIIGSSLDDEAKAGLIQTTTAIKSAFSLLGLQQAVNAHLPALDAAISNFAILSSATGASAKIKNTTELDSLLVDVDVMIQSVKSSAMDPIVRDTAIRHLVILRTLLGSVDALGIDSAMAAYFELVIRLRRAEGAASATTKTEVKGIWASIEKWAGRLNLIDKAINDGSGFLSHFESMPSLLEHLYLPWCDVCISSHNLAILPPLHYNVIHDCKRSRPNPYQWRRQGRSLSCSRHDGTDGVRCRASAPDARCA